MFGRKTTAPAPTDGTAEETSIMPRSGSAGGKGRPTPTRKEAEAARLAKARTPRTRKEAAAADRARRFENTSKMREAMKTGDERYLPARDKGPLRRFTRDFIDSKLTVAEFVLPLLVVTLAVGMVGGQQAARFANVFMLLMLLATAGNLALVSWSLRRQVAKRFPGQSRSGLTYYACVRTLQLRFLRMPKPQVRVGEQLPDTYR